MAKRGRPTNPQSSYLRVADNIRGRLQLFSEWLRGIGTRIRDQPLCSIALSLLWIVTAPFRLVWWLGRALALTAGVVIVVFGIVYFVFGTERDLAYRYSHPGSEACGQQRQHSAALYAADNDELKAADDLDALAAPQALTCMLQVHDLTPPALAAPTEQECRFGEQAREPVRLEENEQDRALHYYLAFLEFKQDGAPVEIGVDGNRLAIPTGFLPIQGDNQSAAKERIINTIQLQSLLHHLRCQKQVMGRENFVIVFIHGWRHNADIGDGDVGNLRRFAAYAASFLRQRCKPGAPDIRFCNATVTAVYLGWRGARLDETALRSAFGQRIGNFLGTVFASITLFDRKPVSERIAPAMISALRKINRELLLKGGTAGRDRMIVFGHSLGGNILASGLQDSMVDIVRRHGDAMRRRTSAPSATNPASIVEPPFGNLVVLINPAAEASKWTAIQRAVLERVPLRQGPDVSENDLTAGNWFFATKQPPIYLSITVGPDWPVGGIRDLDRKFMTEKQIADTQSKNSEIGNHVQYDWATHDLFAFFKFDLRPIAEQWERRANRARARHCVVRDSDPEQIDQDCMIRTSRTDVKSLSEWLKMTGSSVIRNLPFMNTASEETRAIGHFNPMRPPFGLAQQRRHLPAIWLGTTHELIINQSAGSRSYRDATAKRKSECADVTGWLTTARTREFKDNRTGSSWDSGYLDPASADPALKDVNLTPVRRSGPGIRRIDSQFRHGFYFGGMEPITRANDPFWNVRAFDTAVSDHNGYVSYPFICAIHQLVMDDIVK